MIGGGGVGVMKSIKEKKETFFDALYMLK